MIINNAEIKSNLCWNNCLFFLVAAVSTGDAFTQNIQEQAILEPTYGQLKDPSGSVVKGGGGERGSQPWGLGPG